jgi:molecular chaperone GrpE
MKHREKEKPKEQQEPQEAKEQPTKPAESEKTSPALEQLQKEKEELFGKLQRVSADYINFQKRSHKQVEDTIAYEKEKIIKTLLPALDNFEHMLQNVQSAESKDILLKGVRIIYDQILEILKSHGVERIDALGVKFDPSMHEAVSHRAESAKEENAVLEEFQKGYKINGRVLRPSRVIINKLPQEQKVQQEPPPKQEQPPDEITDVEDKTTDA